MLLALGACGSSGGSKPKDAGGDRPDASGKAGTGAAGADAGDDTGAAGTGSAGAEAGAAGTDAGAAGTGAAGMDAGADGDAASGDAGDASEAGGVNTCFVPPGDGGTASASACPAGKAECGGAAGDCETNIATDVMNCGRCGRVCGGAATCTNGLCGATVLLDPTGPSNWCGAVFSSTKAYMITCWGTQLSEVRVAPLEPGATVTGSLIKAYVGVTVVALRGILIDGDSVYYGLEASPSNLWKFPVDAVDGTDLTSASTFENATRFDSLQIVGGDTYWWIHNTHTVAGQISPGSIQKRAKTGATSTTVVPLPGTASSLIVAGSHLYWVETRTGLPTGIYMAPIAGGTATDTKRIADATSAFLVRQGDYVYWTHKVAAPNGKVMRLKIDDETAVPQPVATCLNLPMGLATDENFAYTRQGDAIYRVPLAGGIAEQLSPPVPTNDPQAQQIFQVDAKYVYFAAGATAGDSTLVRVAK
jgi:hypothetical protein